MSQGPFSKDLNALAASTVGRVTGLHSANNPHRKNPAAVALGRKGGKKGGLARAANLTPEERSAIARKAAQARYSKK